MNQNNIKYNQDIDLDIDLILNLARFPIQGVCIQHC